MSDAGAYLWQGVGVTAKELVLLLGPGLLLGLALHYIGEAIRLSSLRLMRVNFFVWLTMPGTVAHELGHVFFCLLFGHKIQDLELFKPKGKVALGQVTHSYNPRNPWHMMGHFFIGTGPIWFGAAVLYGLAALLLGRGIAVPGAEAGFSLADLPGTLYRIGAAGWRVCFALVEPALFRHWPVYAFLYLAFSIGAHMTLSPPDLAGALKGLAVLAVLLLLFNWATAWSGDWSQAAVLWLLRPLSVVYGMMAFALILTACIGLILALLAAWLGRDEAPSAGR